MTSRSLLFLAAAVLAGCTSARRSEPALDCRLHYVTSTEVCPLPRDLTAFFDRLAARANTDAKSLLRPLLLDRQARQFELDETVAMLRSLEHLVVTRRASGPLARGHSGTNGDVVGDTIVAVVDPTCSTCKAGAETIEEYRREHPNPPPVRYVLVPSADEHSQRAAELLESLRIVAPDQFDAALQWFLQRLPGTTAAVEEELRRVAPDVPWQELERVRDEARDRLAAAAPHLPSGERRPYIVYRGRVLGRDNTGGLVFNPAGGADDFALAVQLIRLEDQQ